jgi:signal peptidase I
MRNALRSILNTLSLPYHGVMRIARIACIAAFVIAAFTAFSAFVSGPIFMLPLALVPIYVGIGIGKRRVWSAYGYSLLLFANLLAVPLLLSRPGHSELDTATLAAIPLWLICGVFFLLAGRVMSRSGAERANPLPWIVLSTLCALPLILVQAFRIPTGAMEDTLLIGDRILVQIRPSPTPHRGDLMVMIYPVDRKQSFVKRVIGMPGDRIQYPHFAQNCLREWSAAQRTLRRSQNRLRGSLSRQFPSRTECAHTGSRRRYAAHHVENGELVVPQGQYFVLGDNRDYSFDSRYWGFVGAADLIGKPLFIYESRDPKRSIRWNRLFRGL